MQAISPAYSTLYDTAPQIIIRSCEPHASTDTFVSRESALVRAHTGIALCDQQYRAPSTSSIHSSSCANIRNIWSTCAIRSIALPYQVYYTTSPRSAILVLAYQCVAVKRCRYHAIRGSVVCTCGTYHTSTDGTVRNMWYCCTRNEVRSLPMILGCTCRVIHSRFLVGPRTSRTNEN